MLSQSKHESRLISKSTVLIQSPTEALCETDLALGRSRICKHLDNGQGWISLFNE